MTVVLLVRVLQKNKAGWTERVRGEIDFKELAHTVAEPCDWQARDPGKT